MATATALNRSARFSPAYNLFRRCLEPDLFCAVLEVRPVPTFLEAPNWTFAGRTYAPAQGAFDLEAATTAVRFNGFYLFVALDRRVPKFASPLDHSHRSPVADRDARPFDGSRP